MVTLQGLNVYLRALEPEDLEFVYKVENDERVWEFSLVICTNKEEVVGFIDLYDFNPTHRRAGVGILILDQVERGKGYGKEALQLLIKYGKTHLHLHQMHAAIAEDNIISQDLFLKAGFKFIGQRKDWTMVNGSFKNENLYQHIYVH